MIVVHCGHCAIVLFDYPDCKHETILPSRFLGRLAIRVFCPQGPAAQGMGTSMRAMDSLSHHHSQHLPAGIHRYTLGHPIRMLSMELSSWLSSTVCLDRPALFLRRCCDPRNRDRQRKFKAFVGSNRGLAHSPGLNVRI